MCREARVYTTSSAQIIVPKNIFIITAAKVFQSVYKE